VSCGVTMRFWGSMLVLILKGVAGAGSDLAHRRGN